MDYLVVFLAIFTMGFVVYNFLDKNLRFIKIRSDEELIDLFIENERKKKVKR